MKPSVLVIVEDLLSQMRLADAGISCVALLGTSLSEDQFLKLASYQGKTIVIWLDLDAMNKAVKMQRRLSAIHGRVYVLRSSKEPKELSANEIREQLEEYYEAQSQEAS